MLIKLYNTYILPKRLSRDMSPTEFNTTRAKVAKLARGIVLEIGFGPGYNLPFYTQVEKLYALDPSKELYAYAKGRIDAVHFPVEYIQESAEKIPLADNSIDTVVSTWSLCSIPNVQEAILEIKRVLKPEGIFIFVEHGKHPNKANSFLQRIVTPFTRIFAGNCHLDRQLDEIIKDSGLYIEELQMYPEDGRPLMFSYKGIARKKVN